MTWLLVIVGITFLAIAVHVAVRVRGTARDHGWWPWGVIAVIGPLCYFALTFWAFGSIPCNSECEAAGHEGGSLSHAAECRCVVILENPTEAK